MRKLLCWANAYTQIETSKIQIIDSGFRIPSKVSRYLESAKKRISRKRIVVFMAKKYKCTLCGYIYDPEIGDPDSGIAPNTPFEELPDGWTCPQCGASKSDFEELK